MSILIIVQLTLTHITKTEMFNVNKLAKHIPFQNKIKVLRISTNLKNFTETRCILRHRYTYQNIAIFSIFRYRKLRCNDNRYFGPVVIRKGMRTLADSDDHGSRPKLIKAAADIFDETI